MSVITLFKDSQEYQTFEAGRTIFEEGQPGDNMYIVVEGQVDILVHGKVVDTVGPGDALGEMALIDGSNRSASAIARTESKLVALTQHRFEFMVQQTPFFAIQVMRLIAQRLRRMNAQVVLD